MYRHKPLWREYILTTTESLLLAVLRYYARNWRLILCGEKNLRITIDIIVA